MTRYIFITGGVASSLGKGVASAALGSLLQARGFDIRLRKFDPYLNLDAGTMNPHQHGEVFVTEDGAEADLDLGHYERFTDINAKKSDCVTSGRIYFDVITRERRGDYLGGTVQVIPHITNAIKDHIQADIGKADFVLCEIGGTVGDIEGLPFLESIRQIGYDLGRENVMYIHLTLVPWLENAGELKSKPTQHSVKELLSYGIQPDLLLCRSVKEIPRDLKRKIAAFCNLREERVISAPDVNTIYAVPIAYKEQGLDEAVCNHFGIKTPPPDLTQWHQFLSAFTKPVETISIAIVGKYTGLIDSYKSVAEALTHSAVANKVRVIPHWIDSELLESEDAGKHLKYMQGILVPGGFGERGTEGMINAIRFARENKVPFFGICFGMQMAVIEVSRSLAGLDGASSMEFGPCDHPVVGLMTEWVSGEHRINRQKGNDLGGTMRLGAYDAVLEPASQIAKLYGAAQISERHRHRYEVNINYKDILDDKGVHFAGLSPDGRLPETMEMPGHPWFIGVQFHPELKSRPNRPHPLFTDFVRAARHPKVLG